MAQKRLISAEFTLTKNPVQFLKVWNHTTLITVKEQTFLRPLPSISATIGKAIASLSLLKTLPIEKEGPVLISAEPNLTVLLSSQATTMRRIIVKRSVIKLMITSKLPSLTRDGQLILSLEANLLGFWLSSNHSTSPTLVLGASIDRICIINLLSLLSYLNHVLPPQQ